MLILINAFKSITRAKGRNILIGIIVAAISAASCVALAIRNAANEAEAAGLESISITGNIMLDRMSMMEGIQGGAGGFGGGDMNAVRELMSLYQDLSPEELLAYADSEYVKNFYYSSSISLNAAGDLEPYSTESSSDSGNDADYADVIIMDGGMGMATQGGGGRQGAFMISGTSMAMGDFTVTGYSAEDAMTAFINSTSQITDGEMFDISASDLYCLISSELALFNGLSVGDMITLSNPNSEEEQSAFKIAGIYTDSGSSSTGIQMRFSTAQDPANLIIISYPSLQTILEHSASEAIIEENEYGFETTTALSSQPSSTFVFGSKEDYEAFGEELTEKGLSEYYTLTSSDINNYESSLVPLQNLSGFATTLLLIVLAIGAAVLIIINVFNIRERKYEVGVLTAIGIKKGKVAVQFVTELLCVTLIAIIIGGIAGVVVSVPVANDLLTAQIEQIQTSSDNQEMSFGRPAGGMQGGAGGRPATMQGGTTGMMYMFGGQQEVSYIDQINATINLPILAQLIGIGVLLTLISSLAAVIFVMRYEPLKILANRA